MKKLIAVLVMCLIAIPMLSTIATTEEVNKPYEWVEYGEYELDGKDTARLILVTIYEDISLDYKGWYPQFDEEWQREVILDDIYTAVEVLDKQPQPIRWQIEVRSIIIKIQGDIDSWVINNGNGKDYTEWLDDAIILLENPDDTVHSEIQPFGCMWIPSICYAYFR